MGPGVLGVDGPRLGGGLELLPPEGPEGLQLPEDGPRSPALGHQHRLVDEDAEQPGHLDLVDAVTGADPFGPLEVERAGEHREPGEEALLGRGEQLVGPLHEIAEGAVAGVGGPPRAGQDAEALGQPFGELLRAHRPHRRRRQLEGEGHAVESDADLGDRLAGVVVEHEVRLGGLGPLGEQADGGDLPERVEPFLAARRHRERRHRPHDLTGDAEGLTAGGQHVHARAPPQQQLDELAGRVQDVFAVVEHQQEVLRRQQLGDGVGEGPVGALLHVEGVGDGGGDRALLAHRSQLDEADPLRVRGRDGGGQPVGQAGLAHTAGPEEGEDAAGVEEAQGQLEVALPTDERGGLGRDGPSPP